MRFVDTDCDIQRRYEQNKADLIGGLSSQPVAGDFSKLRSQVSVNRWVAGSSPARGATFFKHLVFLYRPQIRSLYALAFRLAAKVRG
jgi:hypothetical protein